MKQFIVMQSIDVSMCYLIEAQDLKQAEEMMKDREYDRTKIVGIDVLSWDKPWDVMECTNDSVTTMSEEELKQWEILGI
jgi:hypothetical protein